MKKKIFAAIAAVAALSVGVFAGCNMSQTPYVTSIEKSQTIGLVDHYTVTYSDGTTSEITVTNGKNGKDGNDAQNVTARDVYDTYKEMYGDGLSFAEFCEKYLSVEAGDTGNAAVINSCLRSCLKVYTVFHETSLSGVGWMQSTTVKETSYCGSAVVYKMEEEYTYILTNYHVMYDSSAATNKGYSNFSEKTWVYLYGSEYAPVQDPDTGEVVLSDYDNYAVACEYVGGSVTYDVALIKAKTADLLKVNPQVQPVNMGYSYTVGEKTFAVGNPSDGGISVTEGIVSVDSDNITLAIDGKSRSYRSIRTDAALNHGSSGGGLFNMNGELIGLNHAGKTVSVETTDGTTDEIPVVGMNYSIPASVLTAVSDGILYYNGADATVKNTYVTRLGVTVRSVDSRYVYDSATEKGAIFEDVTVEEITSDGLFSTSGLQIGDIITSMTLNGKTTQITRQFIMTDVLLAARAGDSLSFGYTRGGVSGTSPTLTVRPEDIFKVD
ncbi:MAG: S1C family serine protease [Roseburia sp.]|nr:S1C family serine protease [Roseburia sp.]